MKKRKIILDSIAPIIFAIPISMISASCVGETEKPNPQPNPNPNPNPVPTPGINPITPTPQPNPNPTPDPEPDPQPNLPTIISAPEIPVLEEGKIHIFNNPSEIKELKSYSYDTLLKDNTVRKMYELKSHKVEKRTIDVKDVESKIKRKYVLDKFSSDKILANRIKELYEQSFGKIYEEIDVIGKYMTLSKTKFAHLTNTDYDLNAYFFPKLESIYSAMESKLSSIEKTFNTILQNGETSENVSKLTQVAASVLEEVKKIPSSSTTNRNAIKKFINSVTLVPDKEHRYFENKRNEKLGKLKLYQPNSDPYLENIRKIVGNHSAEKFKIEFPTQFQGEFKLEQHPKWFVDYLKQYDNASSFTANDIYSLMHSCASELEMARYIYKTFGEGWNIDFTMLGEYKNFIENNKYYLDINEGIEWITPQDKFKELQSFIITKLNDIIDDRWDDVKKAEAVHNYILWKYKYGTDDEVDKYKNSLGYSVADPYNIISGGNVVCDAYSRTYALFMYFLNIPCRYYGGTGTLDGSSELHAWNEVYLDINGQKGWYPLDLTWNDGKGDKNTNYTYEFFLVNNRFRESHIPDPLFEFFYHDKPNPIF
ncbi:transglutaminase domain-containing protein [Mycoplasmopsis hyopharyngis]|uniref:transglutaminase domain-containing protein n=1 Tax=Mycoplasmopsis hyopharyngis TaxID=29558 RepID=UPI003872AE71